MDIQIGNPAAAYCMFFALIVFMLYAISYWLRLRALRRFSGQRLANQWLTWQATWQNVIAALLVSGSVVSLSLALMDIRWGKIEQKVPQQGIEVVFALDVSRSMLANDITPNRLARAKQQITDMVDAMTGDRIGLVIFAGEARRMVPLTNHYDDFKQTLETVQPHSVQTGGSKLAVALKAAESAFIDKTNDHKAVVMFTDGEDQESEPIKLAKNMHQESGIRIFTVGLGDFEKGARVPDDQPKRRAYLTHNGQQVWSKLNGEILKSIATETGGAYIPAGTKRVNMADVYHRFVSSVEKTEFELATIETYIPRYHWFAALALMLLTIEVLVNSWAKLVRSKVGNRGVLKNRSSANQETVRQRKSGAVAVSAGLLISLAVQQSAYGQSPANVADSINRANQLIREQKVDEAIDALASISSADPLNQDKRNYNLAIAHYRKGEFENANELFLESAKSLDRRIAADSRHNLGNGHYAIGLSQMQADAANAIAEFKQSITYYRSALRLEPSNKDARANIELAVAAIKQLKQQQQQDEQQQNQQQDEKSQQQDEKSQQQDKQQQQDEQQQNQQQQQKDEQQNQDQEQGQQDGDQSAQDQQQNQETDQNDQQQQQGSQQQQEQNQQNGQQQQPSDQNQPSDKQNQPASKQQESTENGQDEQASDNEAKSPKEGDLTAENDQSNRDAPAKSIDNSQRKLTKEEALKLLQAVRDRDLLRRRQRLRAERQNRRPVVERDW